MITVVIPTSPSIVNPDTSIIDQAITSVKEYFPTSKIMVTFDGVRKELRHHTDRYEKFKYAMLEKYSGDLEMIMYSNHEHQSGMMFDTLQRIDTDQLFYMEHDWILSGEIPIEAMSKTISEGTADLIRVLYPTELPSYYMDMMVDQTPQIVNGIPLTRTFQWSQNPHLASTEFYRRIMNDHFKPNQRSFIENGLNSIVSQAYREQGWGKFKTFIYVPEGNTQRCIHLDGRKGEQHDF